MRRKGRAWLIACLVLAVPLAGCTQPSPTDGPGEDPGDGADGGGAPGGDGGDQRPTPVLWREHAFLGSILATEEGRTVYIFTQDGLNETTCTGGCASAWPPVTVQAEPTGPGDLADRLDTIERADGSLQVTLDGRPLYLFAGDEEPGDANGQGRGGAWYVIRQSDAPGQLNVDILDGPGEHTVVRAPGIRYGPNATGYMARPETGEGYPGVVVIHEWWGLNDNIRAMADALASHGYAVLAVDLFNGSVAENADQARAQVQALDQPAATANMQAAVDHLRQAGAQEIASLGWCFGGGQSLQLALSGEALDATVLYYGTPLVTDEDRLSVVEWPVQGVFGDQDRAIPVDQVRAFERALTNQSIEHGVHVYEGVGHAFANPSGDAYAPGEAMDAWAKTLAFLDEHLAQP